MLLFLAESVNMQIKERPSFKKLGRNQVRSFSMNTRQSGSSLLSTVAQSSTLPGASQASTQKKAKSQITLFLKPFSVEASLADNHVCGGYDGQFRMSCELTVDTLDGSGFVTDNLSVIKEVKRSFGKTMLKASCEELACGVVNVASKLVGTRLIKASVRVFNLTGHVQVQWNEGEEIPEFPRIATPEERRVTEGARSSYEPARGC